MRRERRWTAIAALALSLLFAGTYTAYWTWFSNVTLPFRIPGTYYLIGAVALVEVPRAVIIDDWPRQIVALATLGGVVLTIVGLQPTGACAGVEGGAACSTWVRPHLLLFPAGVLLLASSLYLEIQRVV